MMLADEENIPMVIKGMELGINDYFMYPIDKSELKARVKTQLRRKQYQENLRTELEESVDLSTKDGLTSVFNRRYFDIDVRQMVQKSQETKKPLCIMMFDMDHFKQVNDRYGHPMGDKVICTLTEVATQILNRNSDVLARLGGEEFAMLLPATPLDGAVAVAQRLCSTFEATPMVCESGETFYCTISIGIAKGLLGGSIAEREADLISRADVALYQAKNTGRNKVCVSAEEPKLKVLI